MLEAGREERQLAVEHGDFHQGVPAIAVTVVGANAPINTATVQTLQLELS